MNKFFSSLLKGKKIAVAVFCIIFALCAVLAFFVNTNYSLESYLPDEAESTRALALMEKEFDSPMPNARVGVFDVSLAQAMEYKSKIAAVSGVEAVVWLDDAADIKIPLEMLDSSLTDEYYKDGNALFSVSVDSDLEAEAVAAIREIIGETGAVAGQAATNANSREMTVFESLKAVLLLLPLILIILFFSTSSWLEPLLFLAAIGAAVIINMGTNILFGQVSFITMSVSPILQMAVSLDYAIFLLREFDAQKQLQEPQQAMLGALKRAFPAVAASALTTLLGFAALCFMRFGIGADLGLNLVKGVALSFISVMIFLPALTLCCNRLLEKTRRKKAEPRPGRVAGLIVKLRIPVLILVLALVGVSFFFQGQNTFTYGMGALSPSSRAGQDEIKINDAFGKSVPVAILAPTGDAGREREFSERLLALESVTSVTSYSTAVGAEIPPEFVADALSNFRSDSYDRIIAYTNTATEGDAAFEAVEQIRALADEYYAGQAVTLGESVSLYDIKASVSADSTFINLLAIILIGAVVLITFRSLTLPLILLLSIEGAIWINLAIQFFSGSPMAYIGFLVISTVQLGATVDYAILVSDKYMQLRTTARPKEAVAQTLKKTMPSVLISSAILSMAGFAVGLVSSNEVVSQLGILLGRGALLSAAMVLTFLPAVLSLTDKLIGATTLKRRKKHEKT